MPTIWLGAIETPPDADLALLIALRYAQLKVHRCADAPYLPP
jgi:hypothetical protein